MIRENKETCEHKVHCNFAVWNILKQIWLPQSGHIKAISVANVKKLSKSNKVIVR